MKAITTKYHGQTSTKPARVSASAEGVSTVTVSVSAYDSSDAASIGAAKELCKKLNWTGTLAEGFIEPGVNVYVWINSSMTTTVEVSNA